MVVVTLKRSPSNDGEIESRPSKAQHLETQSDASKFNATVMRRLQKALAADSEIDLTTVLPTNYVGRLAGRKADTAKNDKPLAPPTITPCEPSKSDAEMDSIPVPEGVMTVVFPLSDSVNVMLAIKERPPIGPQSEETGLAFARMIRRGEVLYKYEHGTDRMVVKCGPDVVVKIGATEDHVEFTNLQYLNRHCPEIPAPKPLGLVTLGATFYMLTSFIPGITIREAWKDMQHDQKLHFRDHLNELLLKMRSLPHPDDMPLGGVSSGFCKDTRRQTRLSNNPIKDSASFEDFQFSNPHYGGHVYIEFLRRFSPPHPQNIVFTHGDLNAGNIMVQLGENGQYQVTGLIDWDRGGFYPEFFESTKVTSLMSPLEKDDWFLFLPPCISPQRYPVLWLRDLLWDNHVV